MFLVVGRLFLGPGSGQESRPKTFKAIRPIVATNQSLHVSVQVALLSRVAGATFILTREVRRTHMPLGRNLFNFMHGTFLFSYPQ